MIEEYSNSSPEKNSGHSDEELVVDFTEVKSIVEWLATEGKEADEDQKQARTMRINQLLMKYEISPASPGRFMVLRARADEAFHRIRLKDTGL